VLPFGQVVSRVEPVAEALCRSRGTVRNCDFKIIYDDRPGVAANAYQTRDASGRPLLIVTGPLLRETENAHELAFVLGHEAAHHIEGHLDRQQASAVWGAVLIGSVVAASGGDAGSVEAAQRLGAQAGSRVFSKDFELEADALGTVIAARSGFDPVRGADFFARIPDPGDVFLGTHPPNADRQRVVREVAAQLPGS
jgi:predicted Zn-dependent protease